MEYTHFKHLELEMGSSRSFQKLVSHHSIRLVLEKKMRLTYVKLAFLLVQSSAAEIFRSRW